MNTEGYKRWQLKEQDSLSVRAWEDGCVVYHAGSGETHYLTGLASQIFLRLAEGPASPDELTDSPIPETDDETPDDPAALHDPESVLRELVKKGLVEWA